MSDLSLLVQDVDDALFLSIQEIQPTVEDALRQHIESDIYGAFTPKSYERRHTLPSDIQTEIIGSDGIYLLSTTSTTNPNDSWLGYSVYGGENGGFLQLLGTGPWGLSPCQFPRPAVSNTAEEVRNKSVLEKAIDKNLSRLFG